MNTSDSPPTAIYLDNNATTRVSPGAFEAMVPYLTNLHGNPSSAYRIGREVRAAIDHARRQLADLLGCSSRELVFTSCGTESDNAAIHSAIEASGKRHIVTSNVEHSAVKNHAEALERRGFAVTYAPVATDGTLDPAAVAAAIRPDTALVSLMWANNETGVLFPIIEVGALCQERGVLFHTDAVQAVGKIPIALKDLPIDYLSLSGHKLHAPKGVGALYIRRRAPFVPYIIGGHQEKGKRGGTENTASIIALGRAAEEAAAAMDDENTRVRALRDKLENGLLAIEGAAVNGHRTQRLPNTTNISFEGCSAEALLLMLDRAGVCAAAGSACTTGSVEPSHVLTNMGLARERALGAIRLSLARENTGEEIDRVLEILPTIVAELRANPPDVSTLRELATS